MKRLFVGLVILVIIFLLTGDMIAQNDTVTFYKDVNYQSTLGQLSPGIYCLEDLKGMGITNDTVSSLRINGSLRVTLFENDNFGGKCVTYTASVQNVSDFNDKTSSVIVETFTTSPNITVFFEKTNYQGRNIALGNGLFEQSVLKRLNADTLSSLKTPSGLRVTLYEHGDFTGDSFSLDQDNSDLSVGWGENAASVIIESTPAITAAACFYKLKDFSGNHCEFGIGRYDTAQLKRTEVGNDAIPSRFPPV